MPVHHYLVTAPQADRMRFALLAGFCCNFHDTHGDTTNFSVSDEHLPLALEAAEETGVTVERIDRPVRGEPETYTVIQQGNLPGWGKTKAS